MPSLWWHWKLGGWGSSVVLWRSLQIVQGIATDNWLPTIFMIKFVWIIIFSHSFRFKILIDCSVFMWVGCLFFFIRKNGKSAYTSMTMIKQMWATHNFTFGTCNSLSVNFSIVFIHTNHIPCLLPCRRSVWFAPQGEIWLYVKMSTVESKLVTLYTFFYFFISEYGSLAYYLKISFSKTP